MNIEYRTRNFEQQKFFERNNTTLFTSIFCGSLFCGSAVHNGKMKRLEDLQVGQVSMGLPAKMTSGEVYEIPNFKHQITNKSQIPIWKLPATSSRETSKCKVFIPFYCSSLANPAASYGECARWSIFSHLARARNREIVVGNRKHHKSSAENTSAEKM